LQTTTPKSYIVKNNKSTTIIRNNIRHLRNFVPGKLVGYPSNDYKEEAIDD
jgi:hypothetical protein